MSTPSAASPQPDQPRRRLGVAVQGVGGAVATTMVAGIELLRQGLAETTGLPLAPLEAADPEAFQRLELAAYQDIALAGWDINPADAATAAREHKVLPHQQLEAVAAALSQVKPWPAVASARFLAGVSGTHIKPTKGHRQAIEQIRADLAAFRREQKLDGLVLLNLASTEAAAPAGDALASLQALERALDADAPEISPAVLYAYAAIQEGAPYVNFTPSRAADWPAMIDLATQQGVPLCGRDGKTGQTFIKTVLAPAFRDRNLKVAGWFSTNLLGNRDGEVLADPESLKSKVKTKGDVLDGILGYPVANHQVHIHYYPPRGDAKEAWDNIDLVGFLGQPMQVKINFLCRDSILAAPLALDLVRLADLAQRRGQAGPVEELAVFFKSPLVRPGSRVEHDFFRQQERFLQWLGGD